MSYNLNIKLSKMNENIYLTDKIIFPDKFFNNFRDIITENGQIIFQIYNKNNNIMCYAGLYEFSNTNYVIISKYISEKLNCKDNDLCEFKSVYLPNIQSAIIQPLRYF